MAWAICGTCGKAVRWHAGRGARLADLRCACGGTLQGKTAGRASKTKGRHYETCAVCGRKSMRLLHPPRPYRTRLALGAWMVDVLKGGDGKPRQIFEGPCCWIHEPIPADAPEGWPGWSDKNPEWWVAYEAWKREC